MTTIGEVITGRLVTIAPSAAMGEAVRMLDAERVSHLLVVQGGELVGVLCSCDVERAARDAPVAQAMSIAPWTVAGESALEDALQRMLEHSVSCLPVLQGGVLAGMVTLHDLARLGLAPETVARCSACGSEEHVRCDEHGCAVGFCLECARRSEPPAWDDEVGGDA